MKRFIWKAAVTCGLALCVSSDGMSSVSSSPEDTSDPAVAQAGRGGQKAGQKGGQQPGGGGRPGGSGPGGIPQGGAGGGNIPGAGRGNPAAGRPQVPRGVAGVGGRGGIHAPSTNGPRNTVRGGTGRGCEPNAIIQRPTGSSEFRTKSTTDRSTFRSSTRRCVWLGSISTKSIVQRTRNGTRPPAIAA